MIDRGRRRAGVEENRSLRAGAHHDGRALAYIARREDPIALRPARRRRAADDRVSADRHGSQHANSTESDADSGPR